MAKRGGFPGGGMPGNMSNLMKQAQRMQRQMEESAKELESKEFTAAAGGGAVEVTVTGKKDIVIKINELIRQIIYAVHIQLNWVRTENGQILSGYIIAVFYYIKFWVSGIEPAGYMPPCYKMNLSDPRRIFFNAPEPIGQKTPITVTVYIIIRARTGSVFPFLSKPFFIASVHPRNYNINITYHQNKSFR